MFDELRPAEEMPAAGLDSLPEAALEGGRPLILRGAVRDWPLVRAALQSDEAAVEYLLRFYRGRPVDTIVGSSPRRSR